MTPHWLAVFKYRGRFNLSTGLYATLEDAGRDARQVDGDIEVVRLATEYPPIMLETLYKETNDGMD